MPVFFVRQESIHLYELQALKPRALVASRERIRISPVLLAAFRALPTLFRKLQGLRQLQLALHVARVGFLHQGPLHATGVQLGVSSRCSILALAKNTLQKQLPSAFGPGCGVKALAMARTMTALMVPCHRVASTPTLHTRISRQMRCILVTMLSAP